jgi:uncharacterized RDD family membrane protein YckC
MEPTDESLPPSERVLYARMGPRMNAFFIDAAILGAAFLVAALVGANLAGTGAVAFVIWLAFWVLYDPLMVSRTGGTIGHRLQNLRVVSDRTGRSPSLLVAFIRNVVKGILGTLSFVAMAGSSRQKALHDWIAGTTVQARDPRSARLRDFTKVRRPHADARE